MEDFIARVSKIPLAQRLLVVALVILAIVGGTYLFAISPVQDTIANFDRQIEQLDGQLVQKKAIARDLTRYRVEVERLKQRLNEALTLLPNESEIPELLQKLASLVEQSDCKMSQFEPSGEINSGFYARIPVRMKITGNYHSIAVFYDKVAKLARIVNVTDINLDKPVLENKKVVLDATFQATTFKFIEKKPAVAASTVPK